MSNARSPREVCSTTMGTSGLIVLASVSLPRLDSFPAAERPGPGDVVVPPCGESSNVIRADRPVVRGPLSALHSFGVEKLGTRRPELAGRLGRSLADGGAGLL